MRKPLVLLASLVLATVCKAAAWTDELTVTSAFTEAKTDLIVVYTNGGATYTPGCQANSWIFTADTNARGNRAYATVLSALATGKKIKFWYTNACSAWSYHEGTAVMLVN